MHQIFVSHSRMDEDIRTQFDTVFARTAVKSVCMEFEQIRPPSWKTIEDHISGSEALFLLLGPHIRQSVHTQNWVAFEVGLACAMHKDVWIFEQDGANIEFPIPYFTDYMIYSLDFSDHFGYVRKVIEGYGHVVPPGTPARITIDQWRELRGIPSGVTITCPHRNCQVEFSLHTIVRLDFRCPSCRQAIQL